MCGILGLFDPTAPVAVDLYRGALALQHRGQEGAGLVTWSGRFYLKSGPGLLSEVFQAVDLGELRGHIGLAHLRYATAGTGASDEVQPFLLSFPFGLALVHNGNLTNHAELREHLAQGSWHLNSASDSEALLQVLADFLAQNDLREVKPADVFRAVARTMDVVEGAYSVITILARAGLLAFRDPRGIRPLILGRRGEAWAIASESVALDTLDFEIVRDIRPGEAVFIDLHGQLHEAQLRSSTPAHCVFEYVYMARPESILDGRYVADVRERLGRALAERLSRAARAPEGGRLDPGGQASPEPGGAPTAEAGIFPGGTPGDGKLAAPDGAASGAPCDAPDGEKRDLPYDVTCDVPSSAEDVAMAFAAKSGIPYRKGVRKNHYSHRSFIAPNQAARVGAVGLKFHLARSVIAGKRLALIDDSIVRGNTARALVRRLRRSGAKEVHLLSASPPVRYPCVYGVDMSIPSELVAGRLGDGSQIARYLGVDSLHYQTIEDLVAAVEGLPVCTACFTGRYPTRISDERLEHLGAARAHVQTAPLCGPVPATSAKVVFEPAFEPAADPVAGSAAGTDTLIPR